MVNIKGHNCQVVFLILPTVQLLDLSGPVQVFYAANYNGAVYRLRYCGLEKEVRSGQGLMLSNIEPFDSINFEKDDLIIVPGISGAQIVSGEFRKYDTKLYDWLRSNHENGVKICSICNGAFILAQTGLLNGLSCTTHWERFEQLQSEYPKLKVITDQLFVKNESIYTSAGIASGIDLALSVIEEDQGSYFASKVAKELVIYMRRDSHHAQISIYLDYRSHLNPGIHRVQDLIVNNPEKKFSLTFLSGEVGMSTRNLTRIFKRSTGLTINEYTNKIRLELASTLLNNPNLTIDNISARCGFENARHFRRLWKSAYGTSPSLSRQLSNSSSGRSNRKAKRGEKQDAT